MELITDGYPGWCPHRTATILNAPDWSISSCCNYFVATNKFYCMDISVIPIENLKGILLTKTLIEKYNI